MPTGQNHVRMLFDLSQHADITIRVLNSRGAVVRELDEPSIAPGWSSIWYFGYGWPGHLLPAGTYTVTITASNSRGGDSAQTELTIGSGA